MKLKEYIKKLNDILEEHGDLECIYSSDDEGNNFQRVNYSPQAGNFEEEDFNEVDSDDDKEINCVCIN